MTYIQSLLSKITMYQAILHLLRILIGVTVVLSLFGVISYPWWYILGDLTLFIAFCLAINYLFAKLLKVKPNYESQYITAEILTLIVGPLHPISSIGIIFLISFIAMASKYILVYNKQHLFNPAAIGVLASALLVERGASWWIGGKYVLPFVLVGGLLLLQKLRWFHLFFAFLISYLAALIVSLAFQGTPNTIIFQALQSTILDSALIFFAVVMLVEPITAPKEKNWRIGYGILVGLMIVGLQAFAPSYGYSFETSLLVGNIFAFLVSNKSARQTLKLLEKKEEAKDTFSFWFEPLKRFEFIPGQFLEWTLPHKHDSRGIRRFFTISSSPTENKIRLITRSYPKPSTFKQTLFNMQPGDEIDVSQLQGEFVLPKDSAKKIVFIAGGVGIAPFLSIMKFLIDKNENRDIILLNSNKTTSDIGFQDLISQAESIGLKHIPVITEAPENWTGHKGFITPEIIKQEIPDFKERSYYISGPEVMVINYLKMLTGLGIPRSQIKKDYFPGY